jgi:hypothetical protein
MKSPQSKLSRRNFLLAAGAGSAVAATALVTQTSSEVRPPDQETVADTKGYRLTQHIRNYYRTAKV